MVAGTDVSRLLAAYEAMSGTIETRIDSRHHEATVGDQAAFFDTVKAMTTVLQGMGNPFQDESPDLLSLDTRRIPQTPVLHSQSLPTVREDCRSSRCSSVEQGSFHLARAAR